MSVEARFPQHHAATSQALPNSSFLVHPGCFCILSLLAIPLMCQARSCLSAFAQPQKEWLLAVPCRFQHSPFTRSPEPAWDLTWSRMRLHHLSPPSTVSPRPREAFTERWTALACSRCQSLSKEQSLPIALCFNGWWVSELWRGVQASIAVHLSVEPLLSCDPVGAAPGQHLR